MKKELLDILCEPVTGAVLHLTETETRDGEVFEGALRSVLSGKEYPIRDGIPRFVPSGAYTESFGLQWNRFSRVQLDSANGARYSHRRFESETGWTREQVEGRWMLDGGCGCGRFAEVAAGKGARVIALDYSSAVDAAARNLAGVPNVYFVQADLLTLPIKPGALDFAYSLGVLQHTPDPEAATRSILRRLGPGGRFAFTIYARRWYTKLYSKYLLRPVTRRIPSAALLSAVEKSMPLLFPITSVLFSIPGLGKMARFAIPVANYVEKRDFTRDQRYQEAILDTFDMLSPTYDLPVTAEEIEHVLRSEQVREFRLARRVPVTVTGTMPGVLATEPIPAGGRVEPTL